MKQFFVIKTIFFQLIITGNYYAYFKDLLRVGHLKKKIQMLTNVFLKCFIFFFLNINPWEEEHVSKDTKIAY